MDGGAEGAAPGPAASPMKLTITTGNHKLGKKVGNLSLPPIVTCIPKAPCGVNGLCYALKAWRQYPNVRTAWSENYELWQTDPREFELQLHQWLERHGLPNGKFLRFRWHVGGDIPDKEYLLMMRRIAVLHPQVRFRAFTKRYEFFTDAPVVEPANLVIGMSRWPGLAFPEELLERYSQAWYDHPRYHDVYMDTDVVKRPCPGSCETCHLCWGMKAGESVVFKHH